MVEKKTKIAKKNMKTKIKNMDAGEMYKLQVIDIAVSVKNLQWGVNVGNQCATPVLAGITLLFPFTLAL